MGELKGQDPYRRRPGGVPEMTLEYVLKNHGLIPNQDVNVITNIQLTAVPGAFKGGTGDYAAIFEPMASMLEREESGSCHSLGRGRGGRGTVHRLHGSKGLYREEPGGGPEVYQRHLQRAALGESAQLRGNRGRCSALLPGCRPGHPGQVYRSIQGPKRLGQQPPFSSPRDSITCSR